MGYREKAIAPRIAKIRGKKDRLPGAEPRSSRPHPGIDCRCVRASCRRVLGKRAEYRRRLPQTQRGPGTARHTDKNLRFRFTADGNIRHTCKMPASLHG